MLQTFDRHAHRVLLAILLTTLVTGILVFHFVEHFSWLDAYYFSVVTLATVGYGDLAPHTAFGKIFTTFYIFIGVGVFTTFISLSLRRRAQKYSQRDDSKPKS